MTQLFLLFSLISLNTFAANSYSVKIPTKPDRPNFVIETSVEKLAKDFHNKYNGLLIISNGQSHQYKALDHKTHIELFLETSKGLAEYALYSMRDADEVTLYTPAQLANNTNGKDRKDALITSSTSNNFFARRGESMWCAAHSFDLYLDIFYRFDCRTHILPDGSVVAPHKESSPEEFAKLNTIDLFYSPLDSETPEFIRSEGGIYSDYHSRSKGQTFDVQFYGDIAVATFNLMKDVAVTEGNMRRIKVKYRYGKQIWCALMGEPDGFSKDPNLTVKCRISFDSTGKAIPPTQD